MQLYRMIVVTFIVYSGILLELRNTHSDGSSMQYRALGKVGIEVSVIGFGASTFGDVYGTVTASAAERAVAGAIDRGINLFDVSPYYGLTLAEARLGQALEGKRSKIFLGTKCGRYGVDEFDFSGETLTRNFEQSLCRLKTDYVDLL